MDEYYMNEYQYLKKNELKTKIINNEDYKDIIKFIIINQIDINSFIKVKNNFYAPLIYIVMHSNNIKLFKWLFKQTNINLNIKYDKDNNEYIPNYLITCNEKMFKYIKNISEIKPIDIIYCLKKGLYNKLKLFDKNCLFLFKNINDKILPMNIEFDILKELLDQIYILCMIKNNKDTINELINNYIKIYDIIYDYINILNTNENNITFIQLCIDWYLLDIVKLFIPKLKKTDRDLLKIKFYKDYDNETTAVYRQLYNDYNYYYIAILINNPIDERAL
jgi:hypothetical protein